MLEIVHEIIEAEQKAAEIVKSARDTASKLKSDFEREANERIGKVREEVKLNTRKEVEEAQQLGKQQLAESNTKQNDANAHFRDNHKKEIDDLISDIIQFIITPEFQKD